MGEVLLIGDYNWFPDHRDLERVALAVDTFLAWDLDAEVIRKADQVALRRRDG